MKAPAAEIAVIGGMIGLPEETGVAFDLLTPEMFTNPWLADVFAAAVKLRGEGQSPDVVQVLGIIGDTPENKIALVRAVESIPSFVSFPDYCGLVLSAWRRREILTELDKIRLEDPPVREMVQRIEVLVTRQKAIEQGLNDTTAVDFWGGVMRYMDDLVRPNTAIQTGWNGLDMRTGGLRRKGFYLVKGRSGTGKTDFSLSMATNIAARHRVSYLSMEMPVEQLYERIASRLARVDASKLRDKKATPDELQRIMSALSLLKDKAHLIVDEQKHVTVADIERKILRQSPDLLIVDHFGLMRHNPQKRNAWEAVAESSVAVKNLADRHNIVIVALVQEGFSGDKKGETRTKGSDNLTNDADGIFRMTYEKSDRFVTGDGWLDACIEIEKNRHGGTGKIQFHWQPQYHEWRMVDTRND